jgi:Lar family restriction alleviation protein
MSADLPRSTGAAPQILKPCQFCGSDAAEETIVNHNEGVAYTPWFQAVCRACDFALPGSRDEAEAAAQWNRRAALPSQGSGMMPNGLSLKINEAIAKVNADCRRFLNGRPLATIDELLTATPEQGTDIGQAMTTAMFGSGYMLSHERRLLAITLARALPELDRLRAENTAGAADHVDACSERDSLKEERARLAGQVAELQAGLGSIIANPLLCSSALVKLATNTLATPTPTPTDDPGAPTGG